MVTWWAPSRPSSGPAGRSGVIGAYVAAMRRLRRLAVRTGLLRSLERRRDSRRALYLRSLLSVHDVGDMMRLDLAWWPFEAMARIETFLEQREGQAVAFEYGPGASTAWLARRCRRVDFVEHDAEWWSEAEPLFGRFDNVFGRLVPPAPMPPGATPVCRSRRRAWAGAEFADYVHAIREAPGPFDLIVIDGRAREACLAEAERHLKKDGIIVFDDARRRRYRAALAACGLAAERCRGLTPTAPYPSTTLLLARRREFLPGRAEA
jgi:hypothetical protein